jgi:heterodisulfide reductase subunit A
MKHFTDRQINSQIDTVTEEEADKKVVAFCCNWCSYAGADFAGVSRMQYPPEIRIIRTMCSGRVSEKFVLRAFENGAAAVLVAGCHLGDCHYIDANYQTDKRVNKLWDKLEQLGIDKERLQLAWISAAEGEKFAKQAEAMSKIVKKVTKDEIKKTVKILKEEREKEEAKMKRLAEKRAERKAAQAEAGAKGEEGEGSVAAEG